MVTEAFRKLVRKEQSQVIPRQEVSHKIQLKWIAHTLQQVIHHSHHFFLSPLPPKSCRMAVTTVFSFQENGATIATVTIAKERATAAAIGLQLLPTMPLVTLVMLLLVVTLQLSLPTLALPHYPPSPCRHIQHFWPCNVLRKGASSLLLPLLLLLPSIAPKFANS